MANDANIPSMSPDSPSLNVIFDAVKERVEDQKGRIAALDTKAGFTLGAATILTGGISTLTAGLAGFTGDEAKPMKHIDLGAGSLSAQQIVALVVALILAAYAFLVFTTFQAFRLRSFAIAPEPTTLRKEWSSESEQSTKAGLVDAMVYAFETNKDTIKGKTTWTNRAILAIVLEASLTLVVGMLQLWLV